MGKLKVNSLQWSTGVLLMFTGTLMLVAPHQFDFLGSDLFDSHLPVLGSWIVILGIALAGLVVLKLSRSTALFLHLSAGTTLLLIASIFAYSGSWLSAILYTILSLGISLSGFSLAKENGERQHPAVDSFSVLIGISSNLIGLVLLLRPNGFTTPLYSVMWPLSLWFGGAFFACSLFLLIVLFARARNKTSDHSRQTSVRRLVLANVIAHWLLAIVFFAFQFTAILPERAWIPGSYFVGFGIMLAITPWLGTRYQPLTPNSLRTRVALTLAITSSIPLIATVALATEREEQSLRRETLARQETQAADLARHMEDSILLHQAALKVLIEQPGLSNLPADDLRELTLRFTQNFPDVFALAFYDAQGNLRTSHLNQPIQASLTGSGLLNEVRSTGQPSMDFVHPPMLRHPILVFGSPFFDGNGQFAGLATVVISTIRLEDILIHRSGENPGQIYLVDEQGHAITNQHKLQITALQDLSDTPPVRALLSSTGQDSITYKLPSGEQLVGYARVPELNWGVVIERPAEEALQRVKNRREMAFGVLVLTLFLTGGSGILMAGWVTSPLNSLAYAARELARGNAGVPLPKSEIAEVESLAAAFGTMRDHLAARTAEREEARRVLNEQHILLESILSQAADGIMVCDSHGNLSFANAAARRMAQISESSTRAANLADWGVAYGTDGRALPDEEMSLSLALCGKTTVGRELHMVRANGSFYDILISATPLNKADGSLMGAVAVFADITARKQAEQALQNANTELESTVARRTAELQNLNQRLQTVLRSLPIAVWIADADGKIVEKNAMVDKIWGGSAPLSASIAEYREYKGWRADNGAPVKASEWGLARAISKGETSVGEVIDIQRFDGTPGTILNSAAPITDQEGNFLGAVAVSQDITQQRKLEQQAQEAASIAQQRAAELDAVFSAMTDAVIVFDAHGLPQRANPTAAVIYGINPNPKNRLSIDKILSIRRPDGRPISIDELPTSRALQGEIVKGEYYTVTNVKGQAISIVASTSPLFIDQKLAGIVAVWHDVTELELAEQAVRESEAKFRGIFEANIAPLVFWTTDGRLADANDAFLELAGYSRQELEQGLIRWETVTQQQHFALDQTAQRELLSSRTIVPYEEEFVRRDGQRFPVLVGGSLLPESSDTGIAFFVDLTERKQAEAAIKQSEKEFRAIFELAAIGKAQVEAETGRFLRVNRKLCEITGFSEQELQGMTVSQLTHPEDREIDRANYERVIQGEENNWSVEKRYLSKNGSPIWVEVVSTLMRAVDGKPLYSFTTVQDITARKHLEKENERQNRLLLEQKQMLMRQNELLQTIFEADPNGIAVITGPDLEFLFANPAYRSFTPYPEVDPVGRPFDQIWPPSDEFRGRWLLQRVLSTGKPVDLNPYAQQFPDGSVHYFSYKIRRIPWADQPAVLVVLWETTQIEEAHLRAEAAALEARRRASEAEEGRRILEELTQKLERSNRELQDFAFIASHDLQEPLRKIQAFGERLKLRYHEKLGDEGQDFLERMQSAVYRMQAMINGLLAYSRVTTQAMPHVTVDLSKIAAEVISDLEIRIEKTNARVELGQLPVIEADILQMRQLFQNLIGNALKFHRAGIPPHVKIYSQPLEMQDLAENEIVQILVEDNGIGFDVQSLNRIFQPFQRLVGRSEFEGSGIGLAICRKIIERHRGGIAAHSRSGEGSTFIITLPVKQSPGEGIVDRSVLQ